MKKNLCLLALSCAALLGCSERPEPPSGGTAEQAADTRPDTRAGRHDMTTERLSALHARAIHDGGIAWHEGDIDSAFALAAKENKPLFLYWGAEWCPPCNQIKVTIFNRREFIDTSRLFVPVYLDGDTENAQRLGEQFGVMGYPTMVVFASNGEEITRIPGGINIELYAGVLDLALDGIRPVEDILAALMAGETLDAADWRMLAYYSWGQDNQRILKDLERREVYRLMADACPDPRTTACSRLYVWYLDTLVAEARNETSPEPMTEAQKREARERIGQILSDHELVVANLTGVIHGGGDIVGTITDPHSSERDALKQKWLATLDRIWDDESISTMERLYTARGKLLLERMDDADGKPSEALRAEINARVAWADGQARTNYERSPVINAAWNTLYDAGMDAEADALATAELEKSKTPYYFMLDLAETARRAGRSEEALAWLERAYEKSEGPATRFQWGYNYLVGLLELAPDDSARIQRETLRVFAELDDTEGAFYQRTRVRLGRLDKKFQEWNTDGRHAATIESIREGVLQVCGRLPAEDEGRETCEAFLREA